MWVCTRLLASRGSATPEAKPVTSPRSLTKRRSDLVRNGAASQRLNTQEKAGHGSEDPDIVVKPRRKENDAGRVPRCEENDAGGTPEVSYRRPCLMPQRRGCHLSNLRAGISKEARGANRT